MAWPVNYGKDNIMTNANTNQNTIENLEDLVGEAGEMPAHWAVELRDQAAEAFENFEKVTALLREKTAQNEDLKSRLAHAQQVAGLQSVRPAGPIRGCYNGVDWRQG